MWQSFNPQKSCEVPSPEPLLCHVCGGSTCGVWDRLSWLFPIIQRQKYSIKALCLRAPAHFRSDWQAAGLFQLSRLVREEGHVTLGPDRTIVKMFDEMIIESSFYYFQTLFTYSILSNFGIIPCNVNRPAPYSLTSSQLQCTLGQNRGSQHGHTSVPFHQFLS